MATPMPKPPVYGYAPAPSAGAPTDYLFQPRPATPAPQPFDINALLALLGGGGQKPKNPPSGTGMGGIGPGPMIMPVNPNQPALPIGMNLPPRSADPVLDRTVLDDMSPPAPYTPLPPGFVPQVTPQTGMGGMGATPPYDPRMGAVTTPPYAPEDPYSTTTSRDMGFGPNGQPPMPTSASGGGIDVQRLLAALRAMQSARQPAAPTITPPQVAPTPQGRSPSAGMGLDGLLNAIRASKRS